ncbi:hypothetical protein PF003_g16597 [Phytophthora fragariae]|nr:hypothetical protein PF003_g16597 [Phytophthora fragariae]
MEELRSPDPVARSVRLPPTPAKTTTASSSVSHSSGSSQDSPLWQYHHHQAQFIDI